MNEIFIESERRWLLKHHEEADKALKRVSYILEEGAAGDVLSWPWRLSYSYRCREALRILDAIREELRRGYLATKEINEP